MCKRRGKPNDYSVNDGNKEGKSENMWLLRIIKLRVEIMKMDLRARSFRDLPCAFLSLFLSLPHTLGFIESGISLCKSLIYYIAEVYF